METLSPQKIYLSLEDCAAGENLPIELLSWARKHKDSPKGAQVGFHQSSRVYFSEQLSNWIREHRAELENTHAQGRDHWLTERAKYRALLDQMAYEEKRGRLVDKDAVKELLDRISTAMVALINSRLRQELPARLNLSSDHIAEIDKIITELFSVLQKNINTWK